MDNKRKVTGLLAVAAYYVMGGFDFILIDHITSKIPATLMISFRLIICGIVLAVFTLIRGYRFSFSRRGWLRVIVCALLGIAAYYIVEALGIGMTSGSVASLVLATIPLFGIVSGAIFFREKVTARAITCIAMSVTGVVLVVMGNDQSSFSATIAGILVMVLAALIWVSYIVAVKPVSEDKDPLELTTLLFIIGGAMCLPVFFSSSPAMLMSLTAGEISLTALSAIFMVALGQLLYIYGVDKVSVSEVSLYANFVPIVTVIFSFIFFQETLSLMQLAGGVIILISVTVASKQ